MLDSLFSTEHMYSRMTVFAEVEHLTETQKAVSGSNNPYMVALLLVELAVIIAFAIWAIMHK